jgi:hypothetical protein
VVIIASALVIIGGSVRSGAAIEDPAPAPARSLPGPQARRGDRAERSALRRVAHETTQEPAPLEVRNLPSPRGARPGVPSGLQAHAGDDQIGLVDHQITLNGGRSRGEGALGFRWIQVAGPQAVTLVQEGHCLLFTPKKPGAYRFALVVASGNRISEPDWVEVLVGTMPPGGLPESHSAGSLPPMPVSTENLARTALTAVADGTTRAAALAENLQQVAWKVDLYETYGDVLSELSRRLVSCVPSDPMQRAVWDQKVFHPLSARLVEHLREEGLDLSRSEGSSRPFTMAQKRRLAAELEAIATGFRSAGPKPGGAQIPAGDPPGHAGAETP